MSSETEVVDLRSDTVTRPDSGMREAMAGAEVGDDVLGDDPTTRRLEERVAELTGKDRALFFPSGIMANQTALAVLGAWGGEVVCEADAHLLHWEEGAAAALSGVQLRPVVTDDGHLSADLVRGAIRSGSRYMPRTRAVTVENTHLASGGTIMSTAALEAIGGVCREHDLPLHLDGARLWHACAERDQEPSAWTDHVATVMVSLSKGLGAPVGSILAGPADVMDEAWRVRRRLGGGMRQSGVLAAAALYALEHNRERLAEDHAHARELAHGFDRFGAFRASEPETNIVLVEVVDQELDVAALLSFLDNRRILMLEFGRSGLRAVTHRDVTSEGIQRTIKALGAFLDSRSTYVHLA